MGNVRPEHKFVRVENNIVHYENSPMKGISYLAEPKTYERMMIQKLLYEQPRVRIIKILTQCQLAQTSEVHSGFAEDPEEEDLD